MSSSRVKGRNGENRRVIGITTIDFEQARLRGGGRIEAFNVFLMAELSEHWTQIAKAVDAFRSRQVRGKLVLDVRGCREP